MKIDISELNERIIYITFDFWEIESMGFDVIKKEDKTGNFYNQLAGIISKIAKEHYDSLDDLGIICYLDNEKGNYCYKIMPYDYCYNALVFNEMRRTNKQWVVSDGKLWIILDAKK